MTILRVADNTDIYSRVIRRFAGSRDYAIGSDGSFEIDGKCSFYCLGIDENGSLHKGQFFNGKMNWYPVTSVKQAWKPS